eukprot:CAMPEP_0172483834 /NCGR_PEP_ID=MMETSP1066-20121228/11017_1 /TAXON_ID=671091 /ORGANISM="Coscinodiscus wailesii, Strain CCMP2513" /LENGTH=63 /DNA_ID=CAMNT_0013247967 /DNA_START=69 /DNA_END=257 /DNA_ORIENTATION=+
MAPGPSPMSPDCVPVCDTNAAPIHDKNNAHDADADDAKEVDDDNNHHHDDDHEKNNGHDDDAV